MNQFQVKSHWVKPRPPNFKDLSGQVFGRLRAISRGAQVPGQETVWWNCVCECGTFTLVRSQCLLRSVTKSCGCLRTNPEHSRKTHGKTGTVEYRAWRHMMNRCYNKKMQNYVRYGAKGVTVCPEWRGSFETFYAELGDRPSARHSLDRIDGTRGYESGNCRWATTEEQQRNRNVSRFVEYEGVRWFVKDLALAKGLTYKQAHKRLFTMKWSVERTFSTPRNSTK